MNIAHQTGDRNGQFEAHQGLGRVHHATTSTTKRCHYHHAALHLALDLDQHADQARAHDGLAHAHHALDNPTKPATTGKSHWICSSASTPTTLKNQVSAPRPSAPTCTTSTTRRRLNDGVYRVIGVSGGLVSRFRLPANGHRT